MAVPLVVDLVWTSYSEAAHLKDFESLRPPLLADVLSSLLFSANIPQPFPSVIGGSGTDCFKAGLRNVAEARVATVFYFLQMERTKAQKNSL